MPGDLYVEVYVKEHEIFKRDGDDLYCEIPIRFSTAALGGEIKVPTLGKHVMLKVPSETQSGRVFRMRGKGVCSVRSHSKGDLLCRVIIETPVKLNKKQKALLQEFDQSFGPGEKHQNPKSSGWKDSVRQFFDNMG